ncbi:hypothetical protein LTS14_006537 [Recurvomyces mirabilis]|nr:hypothetical protein LTS14_006537 [Recurvomyces mirabilis]
MRHDRARKRAGSVQRQHLPNVDKDKTSTLFHPLVTMPNGPVPLIQTMSSTTSDPPVPGQERPYPEPTETGKASFHYSENGLKGETAYKVWGHPSSSRKTPLICVHGGPGATHNYLLPISLIHQDYGIPVVMYDQVGCGLSTRFRDKKGDTKFWTPQLFMSEFENLCSHLGITKYSFLGQSWGGMLGGQFAIERQPKGMQKLIISNSPADMITWVEVANRLRAKLPKDVQEALTRNEKNGTTDSDEYHKAVEVFYRRHACRNDPWPKEALDTFTALEEDPTVYETMNGPSEFFVIGSLKTWDIRKDLHKITAETVPGGMLIMNGYHDEAQDETTAAFFTNPTCRVKWVRYALSSHMPMLEETEKYVKDLGTFLTSE